MIKQWELIAFDLEGNKVKVLLNFERECYEFAKNHGLEVFSVKSDWYGISVG